MCSISECNDFFWPLSAILSTMEKPIVFIYFLPDNLWTVPSLGPMAPSRSLFVYTWTNLSVFRFLQSSGVCGKLGQTRVIHVVTHWCVNSHKCLQNILGAKIWLSQIFGFVLIFLDVMFLLCTKMNISDISTDLSSIFCCCHSFLFSLHRDICDKVSEMLWHQTWWCSGETSGWSRQDVS